MLYFEDFAAGEVFELGSTTVSEAEIVAFAKEYDPQPFHVDRDAAERSMFGGIIASGWHTCALTMRLMVDGMLARGASLGSPGIRAIALDEAGAAGGYAVGVGGGVGGEGVAEQAGPRDGADSDGGHEPGGRAGDVDGEFGDVWAAGGNGLGTRTDLRRDGG